MASFYRGSGIRVRAAIGVGLAIGAIAALGAPVGIAAADPGSGPGFADPVVNDYLDRVNALVDQFSGKSPASEIGADEFNSMLNAENSRLLDALIAAKLPR